MGRTLVLPTSLKIVAAAAAFLLWGLVLAYASSPAHAATTYTVDRTDDPDLSTTPTAGACTAAADDCSLRGAITAANANAGDDTIDLLGVSGTVNLTGALPDLSSNIEIKGPGADQLTVRRDTGGNYRIFNVLRVSSEEVVVSISGITITNGNVGDSDGGGIANGGGTVTLANSTISGNTAGRGGGIVDTGGTTTITNSTISGNTATQSGGGIAEGTGLMTITNSTINGNTAGQGGGIANFSNMTLEDSTVSGNTAVQGGGIWSTTSLSGLTSTITNSTISGNTAAGEGAIGGGVFNTGGLTVVEHSTVTSNTAPSGGGSGLASCGRTAFPSCMVRTEVLSSIVSANTNTDVDFVLDATNNTFLSKGYNLIGDGNATAAFNQTGDQTNVTDPKLEALAENGGPTLTHELLADSPAIDKGNSAGQSTDQRGEPRPHDFAAITNATDGDGSDIGSFEVQPATNEAPTVKVDRGGACRPASDTRATINLTLSDPDDPPENLFLSATSSDQSVVPNGNISFGGGTDASRTLSVSALAGSGSSSLTVEVNDGDVDGPPIQIEVLVGTNSRDTLTGSADPEMIFARRGNDTLSGQGANDLMCGANGKDSLLGAEGDDTMGGANNDDTFTGGGGADIFRGGGGTDTATDFNSGEGDTQSAIP